MRILALIGSCRKNGNSSRIISLMKEHLQSIAQQHAVPLEFETIFLGDIQLGNCRGCRICMDRGEDRCPVKDDFLDLKQKMKAAHGLLIASPVYVDDVSGIIKTWIDRLAHVCHRPEFAGKSAYAIATTGSSPCTRTLGTLTLALSTWGYCIVGKRGFKTGALMDKAQILSRHDQQVEKAAREFFYAIHLRQFEVPSFRSLMTFKIQQLAWQREGKTSEGRASYDYKYWDETGWLSASTDYYIPHRASKLKVSLARLAGSAIAPLVL